MIIRSILLAVCSLFLGMAPAAAVPASGGQPIALQDFGGRLRSIKLKVNGQEGTFTIDTGGGVSLVSPDFAKKIGCVLWGAHTGFRLTGERLDLPRCENVRFTLPGGAQLKPVAAGVLDLQPLLFKDAPAVDGSIALDAFEGSAFTLDLGNGTLTMIDPADAGKGDAGMEVPIRLVRQGAHALEVVVPVDTSKGQLWMMLDSGGGPPVLLRDRIAAEAGADPSVQGLQPYTLVVAGAKPLTVPTRAIVRDMVLDGVIGMPVMVRWSLTFDLAHDRLWVREVRK